MNKPPTEKKKAIPSKEIIHACMHTLYVCVFPKGKKKTSHFMDQETWELEVKCITQAHSRQKGTWDFNPRRVGL